MLPSAGGRAGPRGISQTVDRAQKRKVAHREVDWRQAQQHERHGLVDLEQETCEAQGQVQTDVAEGTEKSSFPPELRLTDCSAPKRTANIMVEE